ncbi:MAG: SDR family NAD(P)-dependent oxidoreductase, partial [Firmicutes bacterium]|nr:SDR family NAD(P)-dependent oxidoreductase [Bacillota bacterium]
MKIAVITGASSGIGKEFVYAIDKEYQLDEIWVIARRTEELEKLQAECRNKIVVRTMDLLQDASLDLYADLLRIEKPQIELLVNAAGFGHFGYVKDQDLQGQLDMIKLNSMVLTAFCRLSLDYMQTGSAIINLGSNSSWQPV